MSVRTELLLAHSQSVVQPSDRSEEPSRGVSTLSRPRTTLLIALSRQDDLGIAVGVDGGDTPQPDTEALESLIGPPN